MDAAYLIAPFAAWLVAGATKFAINSLRAGRLAVDQIGYGGIPSTHTTVVATPAALIAIREGLNTPVFAVAAALVLIVVIDATGLRRQIGDHATALNTLLRDDPQPRALRERVGHHSIEILAALLLGTALAALLHTVA
jgi:uncharacterized protein